MLQLATWSIALLSRGKSNLVIGYNLAKIWSAVYPAQLDESHFSLPVCLFSFPEWSLTVKQYLIFKPDRREEQEKGVEWTGTRERGRRSGEWRQKVIWEMDDVKEGGEGARRRGRKRIGRGANSSGLLGLSTITIITYQKNNSGVTWTWLHG